MASLAFHLRSHHHKPSRTLLKATSSSNLTFSHLFSSSSSSGNNNGGNPPEKSFPFSSYFSDIKAKLQQHEEQRQSQQSPGVKPQDSSNPSKIDSFGEIRKNLSEFRRRSTDQVPPPSSQQQPSLLRNLSRNVGNPNASPSAEKKTGNLSFNTIRESLRQLNASKSQNGKNMSEQMSLSNYKKTFNMRSAMAADGGLNKVIGGSPENLPMGVFGKELSEKDEKGGENEGGGKDKEMMEMELVKLYNHDELGNKLKELRPEIKKGKKGGNKDWFSFSELSVRLKKLKKIEEEEEMSSSKIRMYSELKQSLKTIRDIDNQKSKKKPIQVFDIMGTPGFMLEPPKEHLVEKYFHPDNMSAEEKLKLELKGVRDEFKMHESDCGSTRVQIAQLTTEILHLSSVLHKKDKHSRRGLLAKVQQRKKLLKYLRRTDWDSYCFVLSKLGLRDNPDYKN